MLDAKCWMAETESGIIGVNGVSSISACFCLAPKLLGFMLNRYTLTSSIQHLTSAVSRFLPSSPAHMITGREGQPETGDEDDCNYKGPDVRQ